MRLTKTEIIDGRRHETYFVGKGYELSYRVDAKGNNREDAKHYIYADGHMIALHIRSRENGRAVPDTFRYMHYDALNSVDTITDAKGRAVERMSYDPFGKRRHINGAAFSKQQLTAYSNRFTNRGYTGHEHMDSHNLIHMNARLYDTETARFLSADVYIQAPELSQSHNRYSYVMNNPLKYTCNPP